MPTRWLKVITKPPENSRTVLKLDPSNGTILLEGNGNLDMLCGKCHTKLIKGSVEGQLQNLVLYCNNCNSYNNVP